MFMRCAAPHVLFYRSRMYQKSKPSVPQRNKETIFGCARLRPILDRNARGAMTMPSRRDFAKYVLAGGAGMLAPRGLWPFATGASTPPQSADEKFDLLIEGGTVIDPSQNLNGAFDVAIKNGKILEVSKNIAKDRALKAVSAKDRIVTPGFIDMHAHCYDGIGNGMNADRNCLGRGVTTVVDAGSAGYATFPNFRKNVINTSL